MAIIIAIALAVVVCLLIVLVCRRYVDKTYSSIDAVLDGILNQKATTDFGMEGDSRLSKLTHKAAKIVQINTVEISQLGQEKQIIQSFISDMSHQMKTPLSGISMYTDLLMEGGLSNDEQQEFLSRMKAGTDKLQWMMDSLVKMSRLEVGAIELAPVPAKIKQTLSDSISTVLGETEKKGISILTDAFDDMLLLHDRKWTAEAMGNILENAVKYSKAGGEIHISAETLPIYTRISITDYGIGIAREEWNFIFKRFYRGQNAKETSGSGLGLYLASLIMEKQGGYILVDSIPGEKTTFSMFLQNCQK